MAHAPQYDFLLPNPDATQRLGQALAGHLCAGDFIALWGDLGAGKTALARAMIQRCQSRVGQDPDEVQSPTFTLVQTYEAGDALISHYDFYRVEDESEIIELGLDDALDQGCVIAEWPERLGNALVPDRLDIHLAIEGTGRRVSLEGVGHWDTRLQELMSHNVLKELERVK